MKRILLSISLLAMGLLQSCNSGLVYEKYFEIEGKGWKYIEPITFEVEVDDISKTYDLYVNVRHTNDYPYSNLWMMMYSYPPDGEATQNRMELRLAYPDGKWIGNGLGANITHEIRVKHKFAFPMKGTYVFTLQHDMREQIVPALSHVGIRIEASGE